MAFRCKERLENAFEQFWSSRDSCYTQSLHPFPVGVLEESRQSVRQHTAKRACRQKNIISLARNKHMQSSFCIHFPYFVASTLLALYLHPRPKTLDDLELILIISSFFSRHFLLWVLCHRPSFSSTELCHRPNFVPSTEFCVIDRVLCHRPSYVWSTEFCLIDRVLCHRPSFVSVLTDERQYLWRVKSNSQIKCSHERYFIFGPFGAPYVCQRLIICRLIIYSYRFVRIKCCGYLSGLFCLSFWIIICRVRKQLSQCL